MKLVMLVAIILAGFVSPVAAQSCDPFENLLATTPAPPYSADRWRAVSKTILTAVSRPNYDTVIIGDSLAEGWPTDLLGPPGTVLNWGVGHDETQHVLWRLNLPQLASLKPTRVVVILGVNNIINGNPACAIEAGLKKVFERLRQLWPSAKIVFIEITPRNGPDPRNDIRVEINKSVHGTPGITSINADEALSCQEQPKCQFYWPDNLHLQREAYKILSASVKAAQADRGQ